MNLEDRDIMMRQHYHALSPQAQAHAYMQDGYLNDQYVNVNMLEAQ